MLKPYIEFRDAIGLRESSDSYTEANSLGFLGRYQFGLARLTDFGLCARKSNTYSCANSDFDWKSPFNEEVFLNNPPLQDAVFDHHVVELGLYIVRVFPSHLNQSVNGVQVDLSGSVACCHLLGVGGLIDFFHGKIDTDAYHTESTEYLIKFSGYEIPLTRTKVDFSSFIND